MLDYILELFGSAQFVPHAVCLLWRPDLLIMHGSSDVMIAGAYFAIPILIVRAVRARPDLLNRQVAWMFAAFITACGLSHLAGLITLWVPAYGFQGVIKVATAAVSIYTAWQLARLMPGFLALPTTEQMALKDAKIRAQSRRIDEQETMLREKEQLELFSNLIQLSNDAIVVWTEQHGILLWNKGAERLYGFTEQEALGKFGRDLVRAKPAEPIEDIYRALDKDGVWQGDNREFTKSGDEIVVESQMQAIEIDGRRFFMTTNRDVTAERSIASRLDTQSRLLELCPDAIVVTSDDSKITYWNEGAKRLYGHSRDEAVGQPVRELLRTEVPNDGERLDAIAEFDGEWSGDLRERTRDGEWITVASAIQSFTYDGQRFHLMINRDVTAERALQAPLETVLNAAQNGIVALDRTGQILVANPSARHMLGGVSAALPCDWPVAIQFLDAEDLSPLEASIDPVHRAMAGQVLKGQTSIMSRGDGAEPRYVRISSASIERATSREIGTVLIIDDVTEQEMNRQHAERSGRLEALGQLTGGIAHDFNNLLATIEYGIKLASGASDEALKEKYHDTALTSVRRGAEMTGRLLAFAKRQPGLVKSRQASEVFTEFTALADTIDDEFVTLEVCEPDPTLWIYCDVAQLENALLNLVLNARDAITRTGKRGRIVVKARAVGSPLTEPATGQDDPAARIASGLQPVPEENGFGGDTAAHRQIEITVADDGPGMSDEIRRRAIDPFFSTKGEGAGTGLGLSMAYGFVEQSGGEMRIDSLPDVGTVVGMKLLRGDLDDADRASEEAPETLRGSGETVLIVDDEVELIELMADLVASLGYSVTTAQTTVDAVEILKTDTRVDLLLTDVVMPGGIGGFQLAAEARALRPELPVLYMSGYAGYSQAEMGEVPARLLRKPSPPVEMAAAIRDAIDTSTR